MAWIANAASLMSRFETKMIFASKFKMKRNGNAVCELGDQSACAAIVTSIHDSTFVAVCAVEVLQP